MKKKRIIISILIIVITVGVFLNAYSKNSSSVTLAAEINEDYNEMKKVLNKAIEENSSLALSSNPYDYIEDNKYYDDIVNKGMEAVPILEEKLKSNEYNDGLLAYITAIAIEEITDCNLKNEKDTSWDRASKFIVNWNSFVDKARKDIANVQKDGNIITEEEFKTLRKYGKLSTPTMDKLEKTKKLNASLAKQKKELFKDLKITDKELEAVDKYLNTHE